MKLKFLLTMLVVLFVHDICFAEFIPLDYYRDTEFFLDSDSVVCDMYEPPYYQMHGDIYTLHKKEKELGYSPRYNHTRVYFYNYNYGNMYYSQLPFLYETAIKMEHLHITHVTHMPSLLTARAGIEMFNVIFGMKFPYKYIKQPPGTEKGKRRTHF